MECRKLNNFSPAHIDYFREKFNSTPREDTGCIAFHGKKAVGSMTFTVRRMKVNKNLTIPVAYAGAIGVLKEYQDHGLGSKMMASAKEFLKSYAKALFVISYFGRHPFGFYRKNGFIPMMFPEGFIKQVNKAGKVSNVKERNSSDITIGVQTINKCKGIDIYKDDEADRHLEKDEKQIIKLFEAAHKGLFGHWERKAGFYKKTCFACPGGYTNYYFSMKKKTKLIAYAICKVRSYRKENLGIIEMGAKNGDQKLLKAIVLQALDTARKEGLETVSISSSGKAPYFDLFKRLGFDINEREKSTVAGMALDVDYMAKKAWLPDPSTKDLSLKIMTPYRELCFNKKGKTSVLIMLEEHQLQRLLFNKLDLVKAVLNQEIRLMGKLETLKKISKSLPFIPWNFTGLEFK